MYLGGEEEGQIEKKRAQMEKKKARANRARV